MNSWSVYNKSTGELIGQTFSTDEQIATVPTNFPDGHGVIEGLHDHLSKRVDLASGKVVEHMPPAPSADHVWNPETKRWQLTAAAADKIVRRIAAYTRIHELEASQHRRLREHALGKPGALEALQAIDDEIFSLRGQLQ